LCFYWEKWRLDEMGAVLDEGVAGNGETIVGNRKSEYPTLTQITNTHNRKETKPTAKPKYNRPKK
jgi:hypothetical protein